MNKKQVIIGALYVARDQYLKDAATSRQPYCDPAASLPLPEGWERVALQFEEQAKACETLIDKMENEEE